MKFRTLGLVGLASALCGPALAQSPAPFTDVTTPHYAFDAVSALAARGVLKGYPDGSYQGRRALTRYEFAAGLNRYLGRASEAVVQSGEDANRSFARYKAPRGLAGEQGARGPAGPRGSIGPDGPRGLAPPGWSELLREHQRQQEAASEIRILLGRLNEELPRVEIEEIWGPLERLDHRLRRAAKPIPGIFRRRRR